MSIFREPGSGRGRGRTAGLLAAGVLLGVGGVLAFNTALEATSTDEFCLGCHNHAIPYRQHQLTAHYKNPYGVVAGCSDCHVQQEFLPKMTRKIEAAREVWGHLRGVIDTDEKYLAHQPEMKERELARFRASDSATCRSCHEVARMDLEAQSPKARREHAKLGSGGKTCVDCHEEAGHASLLADTPAADGGFDF
ncbi:MAG: NapC/NirT family cytochrome c [Pseudomonadales bacterium]|nr:NapC/NirT family cytochrome c [Pseudomonadales bacterium]